MASKKSHANPLDQSLIPPKATFSVLTSAEGPTISVVPVSAMAYVVELITFVPTLMLFK